MDELILEKVDWSEADSFLETIIERLDEIYLLL